MGGTTMKFVFLLFASICLFYSLNVQQISDYRSVSFITVWLSTVSALSIVSVRRSDQNPLIWCKWSSDCYHLDGTGWHIYISKWIEWIFHNQCGTMLIIVYPINLIWRGGNLKCGWVPRLGLGTDEVLTSSGWFFFH